MSPAPGRRSESFAWLDGGYFLVSTYETKFGDEPTQKGVTTGATTSAEGRYRIVFFSNNGPSSEDGNQDFGRLDDGGLVAVNADGRSPSTGGCATSAATGGPG